MGYKNHPAYQAYLNGGVRPDPRLLPRVQQNTDGQYFINPGERYCRWVEPDGMICSQDKLFLSPGTLRNHYFRVHKEVLEKRQDGRNKGMTEDDLVRWYSALTANIAHDWSPRKAKERGKSPPPQPKPSLLSLMGGEPTPLYGPGSDPVPEEDSDDGPPNDSPTALRSQRANHSSEAREPTEGDDSHIVPESDSPGPSNRSKRPARTARTARTAHTARTARAARAATTAGSTEENVADSAPDLPGPSNHLASATNPSEALPDNEEIDLSHSCHDFAPIEDDWNPITINKPRRPYKTRRTRRKAELGLDKVVENAGFARTEPARPQAPPPPAPEPPRPVCLFTRNQFQANSETSQIQVVSFFPPAKRSLEEHEDIDDQNEVVHHASTDIDTHTLPANAMPEGRLDSVGDSHTEFKLQVCPTNEKGVAAIAKMRRDHGHTAKDKCGNCTIHGRNCPPSQYDVFCDIWAKYDVTTIPEYNKGHSAKRIKHA